MAASVYEFGPYRLDVSARCLYRNQELVLLQPKVLDVLILLVQQRGEIVDKEVFFQKVWQGSFVEESNLTQSVFVLRKTLADGNGSQTYIETIPKRGYCFVATVREVPATEPVDVPESHPGTKPVEIPPAGSANNRRWFLWMGCTGGLVVGVLAAARIRFSTSGAERQIVALAVLPFKNLSGDDGQNYLADGLTDSLTAELGKVRNLRVRSRRSAMRYKDSRKTVRGIAGELGVNALLEGSVTRTGNRVRVVCELIDTNYDSLQWSETYDRPIDDVPTLLSEIASHVAREVRVRVSDEERRRLTTKGSAKTDAFEAYWRGRYFLQRGTADSVTTAVEHFKNGLRADAGFAPLYVGLADCYTLMGTVDTGVIHPREARALATGAARQALEIDPDLAEAHASLARARLHDWEWAEAEQALRRSLDLNPSCVPARISHSYFFCARGRFAEALQEVRLARELDPLTPGTWLQVPYISNFARRFDQAVDECRRLIQAEPDFMPAHFVTGRVYLNQGRADLAIPPLEKAVRMSNRQAPALAFLGQAYAAAGRRAEAVAILHELLELQRHRYVTPCQIALVNLSLKNREEFFRWFEKAYEERSDGMLWIKVEAIYDPMRNDARFRRIEDLILRRSPGSA